MGNSRRADTMNSSVQDRLGGLCKHSARDIKHKYIISKEIKTLWEPSVILLPGLFFCYCSTLKKKWAATSIEGLENMTSAIKNFHFTTPSCFSRSSNKHSATTDANGWLSNGQCCKLHSTSKINQTCGGKKPQEAIQCYIKGREVFFLLWSDLSPACVTT